ncbi:hypothetical protein [Symbiobacterium terraclitae]|uniref:hypothetical protein n=1 Tax=Symbiobacterium terraclitae TaxID=557451 RepID=UPI0035B55DE6
MQTRCMIPRQVTTRAEIYPGFGIRELVAVSLGGLLGYLCYALITPILASLGSDSLFLRYVLPILMPAAAWALVMNGEQSILNAQLRAVRHRRAPRRLLFRVGTAALSARPAQPSPLAAALSALVGLLTGKPPRRPAPSGIPTTVQQWLPVQDLPPGGLLLRRDGSLVAAIRVEPRNLALLSESERLRLLRGLRTALNAVTTPENQILSVSRPIDLDGYLRQLDATLTEMTPGRQRLLRQYIRYVSDLVAGGEAQERRYYILLARPGGPGAAEELRQQAADLASRLHQADLVAYTVDDRELLHLLYVFHHPAQASFERPQTAPNITTLAKGAG